ncbi:hypothetical protein ACQP3F_31315, partial [Escherichia coli]
LLLNAGSVTMCSCDFVLVTHFNIMGFFLKYFFFSAYIIASLCDGVEKKHQITLGVCVQNLTRKDLF